MLLPSNTPSVLQYPVRLLLLAALRLTSVVAGKPSVPPRYVSGGEVAPSPT